MTPEFWIVLSGLTVVWACGLVMTWIGNRDHTLAIQEVHKSLNSRMDAALKETGRRAYLEGVAENAEALKAITAELADLRKRMSDTGRT